MKATLPDEHILINLLAPKDAINGAELILDKLNIALSPEGIPVRAVKGESLSIQKENEEYIITYSILPEFWRGLAICTDAINKDSFTPVCQKRQFETSGVMLDLSNGKVLTVDAIKDILGYMALMGLNMAMLYIEDIYEMPEYPMFGYMRGRYSKEELKQIDSFALSLGIEIIPAIQTLSHLRATLKWNYASKFRNTFQTLDVSKKETYDFIEAMFKNISECFTSKRINVGLDEAKDMTVGKFRKEHGEVDAFELMLSHVNKVTEIAKSYGLEPMMWSDMFYKFGHIGGDYDYTSKVPDGTDKKLNPDMKLVYWDYCYDDYKTTDHFINRHKDDLGRTPIFAGGIWNWYRLVPNYQKTFATANAQLKACKDNGVKDVIVTTWGRFNLYAILPGLQLYAEHFYNADVNDSDFSKMYEICTGYKLNDFLAMGFDDFKLRELEEYKATDAFCVNSSIQHFFNDILIGIYDKTLSGFNFRNHYRKYVKYLEKLGDMGKLDTVFKEALALAHILEIKSYIGPELTKSYRENNRDKLESLTKDLEKLISYYKEYVSLVRKNWFTTSKPFGWEDMEYKLSGVVARSKTALWRLREYLDGKISSIDELMEEREYYQDYDKPLTETLALDSISRVFIR